MKTLSTKVPEELAERIDNAREEGENRSAAIRRLIRSGLEEEKPHGVSLPTALLYTGFIFISAQYVSATGVIGPIGIIAVVVGLALMNETIVETVESIRTSDEQDD